MNTNADNNAGTTHTPGPWQFNDRYMAGADSWSIETLPEYAGKTEAGAIKETFTHVATVVACQNSLASAECEANARLIASAPDLLAALERYLLAVDAYWRKQPSAETIGDKCAEFILSEGQARAAIAKARQP